MFANELKNSNKGVLRFNLVFEAIGVQSKKIIHANIPLNLLTWGYKNRQ